MPDRLDVETILRAAQARGYFDTDLLRGYRVTPQELRTLYEELDRRRIPRQAPPDPAATVDRGDAVKIINALRKGTVPLCDLSPLSVGRAALRHRLIADLQDVGRGSPRVRFLDAAYGAGKTHSLWLLAEAAFQQNFAVSFVTLSPASCPLHSMLAVYAAILDGIHTAGSRDQRGLQRLLDRWIDIVQRDGPDTAQVRIRQLAPYFVTTLAEYAGARINPVYPNYPRQMLLLDYLSGKHAPLRELRALGIDYPIAEENALATLKEVTILVRQLGFRGLCIFLDEAESVLSLSRAQHVERAYQNLLHIVRAGPDLRNCYFIYAATAGFFAQYATYWGESAAIDENHIYPLARLSDEEFRLLARRIATIFSRAYNHDVPIGKVEMAAAEVWPLITSIGDFVRSTVAILDRERRDV